MNSILLRPKIYHIVHIDRLASILSSGYIYSDAYMQTRGNRGTDIGISTIKARRLIIALNSYPDLHVGDCVPFYFCPRSVMLYLLYKKNHPSLNYRGGQEQIIHLEADFYKTIAWVNQQNKRCVFTTANAGSYYFDDYCSVSDLDKINWDAIDAVYWSNCKENKQSEFLVEDCFSTWLIERIGVISPKIEQDILNILTNFSYNFTINIMPNWYY